MTTANTSGDSVESRRTESDLDHRYGRIAISALIAALPYGSVKDDQAASADWAEKRCRDRAA